MLERALRHVISDSADDALVKVRKHTMLERELRHHSIHSCSVRGKVRQKAYNAREGIETKTNTRPGTDGLEKGVRKHTMLERALRPNCPVANYMSC